LLKSRQKFSDICVGELRKTRFLRVGDPLRVARCRREAEPKRLCYAS